MSEESFQLSRALLRVPWYDAAILSKPQMHKSPWDLLLEAQKKAQTRLAWSGCLLPFTLAFDALIPLSTFEINLAYFVTQLNGFRKAKHFVDANKQAKQNTTPDTQDLDSIFAFKASPAKLPPSYYTPEKKIDTPDRKIAVKLIHEFKELLDSDVAA
ncbi:hypothetical protein H4Q26_018308 [Puccinia striiformis f. sp. tritici PST-130]|nr:hypothetical protein H4Q26_018308 [Puccinia striiformis f. sp. tritici PST-130]